MGGVRRLVIWGCAAVAGCAWTHAPAGGGASELLPRLAFGDGVAADSNDAPAGYDGPGLAGDPVVERLLGRRGDVWYIRYPIDGPDASLVIVVGARDPDVAARAAPSAEWARTTAYKVFNGGVESFRHAPFGTDDAQCVWFERLGGREPALWGAYCVGADAPSPSVFTNAILRGVRVDRAPLDRTAIEGAEPALELPPFADQEAADADSPTYEDVEFAADADDFVDGSDLEPEAVDAVEGSVAPDSAQGSSPETPSDDGRDENAGSAVDADAAE